MPYSCALAVCTTFCSHIAAALIPIFGPSFPSLCVSPEAPEHGRMIIDSQTVHGATAEAEAFRVQYSSFPVPRYSTRESYSPIHSSDRERMSADPSMRRTPPNLGRSLRFRRAFGGESPYGLMTDTDFDTNASESSGDGYFLSPVTPVSTSSMLSTSQSHSQAHTLSHAQSQSHLHGTIKMQSGVHTQPPMSGWQAHNLASHNGNANIAVSPHHPHQIHAHTYKGPNPLLSAIPRSTGLDIAMSGTWRTGPIKRRVEEVDADDEYDGETASVVTDDKASADWKVEWSRNGSDREMEDASGGAEKKAAWLLMKLSVKDGESGGEGMGGKERDARAFGGAGMGMGMAGSEGPRIKRRRATSF